MSAPRTLIFSIAGAPYRDSFYRLLAAELLGEVIYAKVLESAPDHAWSADEKTGCSANFRQALLPAIVVKGSKLFPNWRKGRNPLVFPKLATWQKLDEWDPDILLIQEYSPISLALLAWAKVRGRKVFVMTEVGEKTESLGALTRLRHSWFGNFVDGQLAHTLAACKPIAGQLTNVCFAPHAVVVPDTPPASRVPAEPVRFVFVGNLIERKGVDFLVAAFRLLHERGYGGRFLLRLVGGGDKEWLRKDLEVVGQGVELAGFKEKEALQEEYRQAEVFVLPSRFDTFGVVSHEAAANGLALILSRHAGSSELFGIQENAAEVLAPENIEVLARALSRLIDDPVLRTERGAAARAAAVKWSAQSNAARTAKWLLAADTTHAKTSPDV